jgi:hypothetical protein
MPATAMASSAVGSSATLSCRSAADTMPVAMIIAKQPGTTPRAERASTPVITCLSAIQPPMPAHARPCPPLPAHARHEQVLSHHDI